MFDMDKSLEMSLVWIHQSLLENQAPLHKHWFEYAAVLQL